MYADIGNPKPIESYLDPRTGETKWRPLPPEAVTHYEFPEGTPLDEAVLIVLDALPHHMDRESSPAWVETDNKDLTRRLCMQFDIPVTKNKRPARWGQKREEAS